MNKATLVVIAGPTAIGKTAIAIELAKHYKTEIISADSRQFYREMNIGTAKPDKNELSQIKHHFINNLSIFDYYSAWQYEQEVQKFLNNYFKKKELIFLVGGSGLYIDAVCYGLDNLPSIDSEIRQKLIDMYNHHGLDAIRFELKRIDHEYYMHVDLKNYKRILHALEIYYQTGQKYSEFITNKKLERPYRIKKFVLNTDRNLLYDRINKRVDMMIESGLIEEAKNLYPHKNLVPLQTVGYREMFNYFENQYDLNEAIRLIKRNTRHYARRQIAWYKRDTQNIWMTPNINEIQIAIEN